MKKKTGQHPAKLPADANSNNTNDLGVIENNGTGKSTGTNALNGRTAGRNSEGRRFHIVIDQVAYIVKSTPFSFNAGTRFYVNVNEGPDHIFTWDSGLGKLRAIDPDAAMLPSTLEEAISERLQSKVEN